MLKHQHQRSGDECNTMEFCDKRYVLWQAAAVGACGLLLVSFLFGMNAANAKTNIERDIGEIRQIDMRQDRILEELQNRLMPKIDTLLSEVRRK